MDTIVTREEFLGAAAEQILMALCWKITVDEYEPGLKTVVDILEDRLAWANEMHAARKNYIDQIEEKRERTQKELLEKKRHDYLGAKDPDY